MAIKKPIYSIAKDLDIDSSRVLSACKTIGIYAKGSTKRLNQEEEKKILDYFKSGKNVSTETIDVKSSNSKIQKRTVSSAEKIRIKQKFFPNRLIK